MRVGARAGEGDGEALSARAVVEGAPLAVLVAEAGAVLLDEGLPPPPAVTDADGDAPLEEMPVGVDGAEGEAPAEGGLLAVGSDDAVGGADRVGEEVPRAVRVPLALTGAEAEGWEAVGE